MTTDYNQIEEKRRFVKQPWNTITGSWKELTFQSCIFLLFLHFLSAMQRAIWLLSLASFLWNPGHLFMNNEHRQNKLPRKQWINKWEIMHSAHETWTQHESKFFFSAMNHNASIGKWCQIASAKKVSSNHNLLLKIENWTHQLGNTWYF